MSDVNTQGAAAAGGAVNFDAGLVKQGAQQAMEVANAAPELPAVAIGGVSVQPVAAPIAPAAVEVEAINTIQVLPFITLSYANPYMRDLKELKAIDIPMGNGEVETCNLYNPFVKANPGKHLHEGVLRRAFAKIVAVINQTAGREVIYLGLPSAAAKTAVTVAAQQASQIERKFPLGKGDTVMELDTDNGPVVLHFGDLFAVHTWVTSVEDDESGTVSATINVNIAVNAGAFYDHKEPHVFVERAVTFVQNMLEGLDAENVNPYIGVSINSEQLQDPVVRELLDLLLSPDMGFALVSRNSVVRGNENWIAAADADKLFIDNSDILLFARAFAEEDEAEGEEELVEEDDDDEDDGE